LFAMFYLYMSKTLERVQRTSRASGSGLVPKTLASDGAEY